MRRAAIILLLAGACGRSGGTSAEETAAEQRAARVQAFQRDFGAAITAGKLDQAEALYAEHKDDLDEALRRDSAETLGSALFNPGGRYEPPPGTPIRSVIMSRQKTPTQDCASEGYHLPVRERELVRSHDYYVAAGSLDRAINVAYRARDLGRFDGDVAALTDPSPQRRAELHTLRVQMLVAGERWDEASKGPGIGDLKFCALELIKARLFERRMEYATARATYQRAAGYEALHECDKTAQARAEALAKAVDGKPLPVVKVTGSVRAPAGATVKVRLIADLADTRNPIAPDRDDLWDADPASIDFWSSIVVLAAKEDGPNFEMAASPGTWNLVVVADGPTPFENKGCWPPVVVAGKDVGLPPIEIVAAAPR
jgi:hypothetical protein